MATALTESEKPLQTPAQSRNSFNHRSPRGFMLNAPKHCCLHPGWVMGEGCRDKSYTHIESQQHHFNLQKKINVTAAQISPWHSWGGKQPYTYQPHTAEVAKECPSIGWGRDFLPSCYPFWSHGLRNQALQWSIKPFLCISFSLCTVLFSFYLH